LIPNRAVCCATSSILEDITRGIHELGDSQWTGNDNILEHILIANSYSCNMVCTICGYDIFDDLLLPVIGSIIVSWKIVVAQINLHVYFCLPDGFKLRKTAQESKTERACEGSLHSQLMLIDCNQHHRAGHADKRQR